LCDGDEREITMVWGSHEMSVGGLYIFFFLTPYGKEERWVWAYQNWAMKFLF